MGMRYILYRVYHIFLVKSRLILLIYPTKYSNKSFISLENWRKSAKPFFFKNRESLPEFNLSEPSRVQLNADYQKILAGNLCYFNSQWIHVGNPIHWNHNPDSNYTYSRDVHWAFIPDLSETNGDIKYVWEKSRFSFLYTIIRYDQHFKHDSSEMVFSYINDWIDHNSINQGPNYKCSQEISLRILNWTFALYYYQNSSKLTEELFFKIINSIRQQLIHVYRNINFSRFTVRNNHAITESMCLYVMGILFPYFPEAQKFCFKGKEFFEKEIIYQIYKDGSYLQFSMNYHRVVIQLLTWALQLSKNNGMYLTPSVIDRAQKTLQFMIQHIDSVSGKLPNYGANDGALFFKLNNLHFRNYESQINALQVALKGSNVFTNIDSHEDAWWYTSGKLNKERMEPPMYLPIFTAKNGGFYTLRSNSTLTTIRCGNHKDRPQQADQNHVDIWYNGVNIIRDNGSYKYNTDTETINYFSGTASHNTIQIGQHNQMLKGGRFIWYYWSQADEVLTKKTSEFLEISANAQVYKQLANNIVHKRILKQFNNNVKWEIEDVLTLGKATSIQESFFQNWHIADEFDKLGFEIHAFDAQGKELIPQKISAWYSEIYGEKTPSICIRFENKEPYFKTIISKNN